MGGAGFLLQRAIHEQILNVDSLEPIVDYRLRFLFEDRGHAVYSLVRTCSFYRSSDDGVLQCLLNNSTAKNTASNCGKEQQNLSFCLWRDGSLNPDGRNNHARSLPFALSPDDIDLG
jgi:hypothetical protein